MIFSIGSIKRNAERTIIPGGVNKVDGEVLCPKLSISKEVFLRIDVKTKTLLGTVRILKRTGEQP